MFADSTLPAWVAEAAALPIAFAQVREDPLVDAAAIRGLGPEPRIIMIASGGCTLAYLAACGGVASIDVVDPNPAQLALAQVKLHLLQNCDRAGRLALLGHAPMPAEVRKERVGSVLQSSGLPLDTIGPPDVWAALGPDHAGRYERVFAELQRLLIPQRQSVQELLQLRDPVEQARRVDPATPLGLALDDAFAQAMSLRILVRLFGEGATRNRVEPFDRHFAQRTRHVLATLPAADNPYLWQVLAGRYPPGAEAPWLSAPPPARLPHITWNNTVMAEALARSPGQYDFVHLSNILDWLSPEEARATLDVAWSALRPGGRVLIRQLNSTLDIPASGPGFSWETAEAQALHAGDRSYFYRGLHLGRKR